MFHDKLPDRFQKPITLFYILTSSLRGLVSPHPGQLLPVFIIVAMLVGVGPWVSVVWVCISTITNIEHLFFCFIGHLYLFGEMSVHFAHF